jgi:hypothetical protein
MKTAKTSSVPLSTSSYLLLLIIVWLTNINEVAAKKIIQTNFPDGVAIQCSCGGQKLIMERNKARAVPDDKTYRLLGYKQPILVPKVVFDTIPVGVPFPPLDSNLIEDSARTIYLVRGGWKWGIPGSIWNDLLAMNPLILTRNNIQKVSDSTVKSIPGYEITPMVLSPVFEIRGGAHAIEDGKLARPFPDHYTMTRLGYGDNDVLHLPSALLSEIHKKIQGGQPYPVMHPGNPAPQPNPRNLPQCQRSSDCIQGCCCVDLLNRSRTYCKSNPDNSPCVYVCGGGAKH